MAFIKVNSINYNPLDGEKINSGKKMIINADSIDFCEISNVSITEGNWNMPATFVLLKMDVKECNIGKYATEIFLKNG